MGLDMYLYREKSIHGRENKLVYKKSSESAETEVDLPDGYVYVKYQVAYWRKANQIHKWFVDNCCDGNDDGRDYYLQREQLEELLATCREVKKSIKLDGDKIVDTKVCEELLPTQEGFFFGDTDYNKYYAEDIDGTIKKLEEILSEKNDDEFIYTASW